MKNRNILFVTVALLLSGCGTTTPVALDSQAGDSVNMALAEQTLNPQASLDTSPVEMIDGQSAKALIDRYHKSFQAPTEMNVFGLGIGTGTGSTLGTTVK